MNKFIYILIIIVHFSAGQAFSQQFPWNAYFGNEGAEFAYDIKQTSDDGYIIAAYGSDGGSSDFYIVKLDLFGNLEWEKSISKDNYSERAFSVLESSDGNYIVVGNATNFNKPWLVKLNPSGDTLWTSQWTNSVADNSGLLARGALLPDGRIVVVSHEDYYALDPYMFIVSEDGMLLEERDLESLVPLGWYSGTVINDIESTDDGGFILTGASGSGTGSRAYLWKFDSNADSSWSVIYNQAGIWMRSAQSVKQLSDGGYILTGFTAPNSTTTAAIRTDENGSLIWYMSYPDSLYTNGTDVIEWKSGEFLITEKRFSGFGTSFFESAVLRIDSLGNQLSRNKIMASDSSTAITQIRRTSDGGFVMAGEINEYLSVGQQDLFVVKSDSLGNMDDVNIDYVWPGDVNYDGEVNMDDLMILGVVAGSSGPARVDQSIEWYAHYVTDWADTVVTGVNFKHADTDGNGIVDIQDTLAISMNYGKTHMPASKSTNLQGPAMYIIPAEPWIEDNARVKIPVYFGSEQSPVEDLYGMHFRIGFSGLLFNADQSAFDLTDSWMGSENELWRISKRFNDAGVLETGMTRVDHQEVSGFGYFGMLSLALNETLAQGWDELSFSLNFENINAHHYNLDYIQVGNQDYTVTIQNAASGFETNAADKISVYPNPVINNHVNLSSASKIVLVELRSMQGELLLSKVIAAKHQIISIPDQIQSGIYLLMVRLEDGSVVFKKLRIG